MRLDDRQIRKLEPAAKPRKYADGDGLYLHVMPSGAKLWRFAYRYQGRQKLLALGAYPEVTLEAARDARLEARRLLRQSEDPAALRRAEKREAKLAAANTFAAVAEEWFENNQPKWVDTYSSRLRSRLDADLLPRLGARPIAEILPIEVLEVVRAIERRGAVEMARRVLQMASGIFRYGVATSRCLRDPTVDLRGALRARGAVKHRAALPAAELPEFLARLEAYYGDPVTRLALKFLILTFVRTSELRFAQWTEFEGVGGPDALWRIPAERMKMRRPHLVPLAPQAVAVLRELKRFSGRSPFVLPAPTNLGVISENTMIFALYRLGYHGRATVHGFRSMASTVLNEHQFNRDWIEAQLAHVDDSVRGIYNAAEWLPGRRRMMLWWADFVDDARERGRSYSDAVPVADPFAGLDTLRLPPPPRRPRLAAS
ncbi:tyrosine-type recombinase/integrase [Phenylobacterium sp.]|uniref:tyrosine-type recombinase/integrase n=1 Tax=Phenylobacterium sp. TaxID=1871053 RepID=UPI002FE2EC60